MILFDSNQLIKNMRKITFLILVLLTSLTFAQEKGKFRVSLDLGYAIPSAGGGGASLYLEPMYNIKDNMSVGIRLASTSLNKEIEFSDGNTSGTSIDSNESYMVTYNYYFNGSDSSFVPFIGGGLGYVSIPNIGADRFSTTNNRVKSNGKFGTMIRGGFEWRKFRLGLDYNFISKSDFS